MNANEQSHNIVTVNLAEERFQWACALAYAYDMSKIDPHKAQEIRDAWSLYHRQYWSPMVAGSHRREKPSVPDYPGKVSP
jgi:hypothetical protein